jgi:tRNA pseudouridine13 synthase
MKFPTDYKLKYINEDFQVTEVPLMPDLSVKGSRKFTYIWLRKSGFTTFEALEQIKNFFKLAFSDVCSQGLKDEDGITEQLISVKKVLTDKDVSSFNKKHIFEDKFTQIKNIIGYGEEPIEEKNLHGNSFRIVIRNLNDTLATDLFDCISNQKHRRFVNYYDNQRFGMPGGPYNTHLIGKAITENNWKQAYEHIKITKNILPEDVKKTGDSKNFKEFFRSMNHKKVSFFVSAYNSFLWNAEASSVINKHMDTQHHLFENVGQLHLPTVNSFQCPHICESKGYELVDSEFTVKPKINKRNLIISTTVYAHELKNDEFHKGKKKITLSFFLPTGSYATMIVKQIFSNLKNK